jgi:redox-sensitive bicupin YhaK (pirin superfamily)
MGVDVEVEARVRPIAPGLEVRRALPTSLRRRVGPFVFLDHLGPAATSGIDVLPHPHIGLATVTYLYDGAFLHRDSLGSEQVIRPGAVNWMSAGRGVVHSERTPPRERTAGARIHGLQMWVALPTALEESAPSFAHHAESSIPELAVGGARLRVAAGSAFGATSPVAVSSPLLLVDVALERGAVLEVPGAAERAVYVVEGAVEADGAERRSGRLLVLRPGEARLRAIEAARLMLLGGDPPDGERHLAWNFVSSSKARIEGAKRDWRERRFPRIPGETDEFVPLPPER